jgi:hypothetical protein
MFDCKISHTTDVEVSRFYAILHDKIASCLGVSVAPVEGVYIVTAYSSEAWTDTMRGLVDDALADYDDPTLTLRDVWALGGATEGAHTLTADKTSITADGVDAATVTVSPGSGEYAWSLWLEGGLVASSATLGVIDLADGYALAIAVNVAGSYVLRVIEAGTYKEITITATEA